MVICSLTIRGIFFKEQYLTFKYSDDLFMTSAKSVSTWIERIFVFDEKRQTALLSTCGSYRP